MNIDSILSTFSMLFTTRVWRKGTFSAVSVGLFAYLFIRAVTFQRFDLKKIFYVSCFVFIMPGLDHFRITSQVEGQRNNVLFYLVIIKYQLQKC